MKADGILRSLVVFLFVINVPYNLIAQNWIPVYRFSNGTTTTFEHLYTINQNEGTGWTVEGIAFYISDSQVNGTVPVYRLRKDGTPRLRLLTTSVVEKDQALNNNYKDEGTLGYIFPSNATIGDLIYRQYKASVGDRFYTMNKGEYDLNLTKGYTTETNLGRSFIYKPQLDLNVDKFSISYVLGSKSVNITSNVSWSAKSNQSWVIIKSSEDGNGNGTINFDCSENQTSNSREATITISSKFFNSKTISIIQAGKSIFLNINPSNREVDFNSGNGSIAVESNVSWTASSDKSWLAISSGSNGINNGTVNYNYSANSIASQRIGIITISNGVTTQSFQLKQNGLSATLTISPSGDLNINSSSGLGSISISSNISWSAVSNQSWLEITSGSSGNNNGTINYSFSRNSLTTERNATISVSGNNVTSKYLNLKQSGQQSEMSFNPSNKISSTSSSGEENVIITSNVNWEAATTDDWLTFFPSFGAIGISSIKIFYNENKTNKDRTGYITFKINGIAKETIEITQKTSYQISVSFDSNDVSHLYWPFYNKNISSNNPISSYEKMNDWRIVEGSSSHTGKELYAQDWNYKVGTPDCGLDFFSPLSGKVIKVIDTFTPVCEQNPETMPIKSYGNYVVIRSDVNDSYKFIIAHLNSVDKSIKDSYIKIGTKIGTIGSTGTSQYSHAHVSLFYDNSVPAKFIFDATDLETGGGGGQPEFNINCYGFTSNGSFYIARSMIEEVEGISAQIGYWDYKNSVWLEKDMVIEGDFYVYHSNDIYNDFRDYCIRVYTNEGETWLPSAILDFIVNKDDFKANPANNGYNFYTKPITNIPLLACAEETSLKNMNQEKLKLFPNPTKDILNICFPDSNDSYLIQIFDITGGVVYNNYKYGNSAININGLKSGLYIIKIQVNKNIYYDKLIIEK